MGSIVSYRSVPTEDQVLVPETLLKKRKSQEKAREERTAELQKKKAVRQYFHCMWDEVAVTVMICTIAATRPSGRCCRSVNHLSGLSC